MNNQSQFSHNHLGVFGSGWSSLGDLRLVQDNTGNVTIFNLNSIETILPQRSHSERTFELQTNGSYQGQTDDKGVLTKEGDIYQLKEKNGTVIVFRADGQLNYVENTNWYRLLAGYTNNRLTRLTGSNGDSITFSYNTQGRISSITDRTGEVVTYKYDSTGRFLIAIENSTGTTSFTYGHPYEPTALTSITYADGSKITYDYDDFGRIQQVILGEGRQALAYTYAYDALGGVTVTDPSGAITQISRNNQGQLGQITDPLGRVMQYKYDADGNLNRIIGPQNFTAAFAYDSDGNLISQTNPLGQTVQLSYETNFGNLKSITDARGNDLEYAYDSKGNLTSIAYEDGSQQSYSYNAKGQLTESTNRRGQDIAYEYNAQHQLVKETRENGSSVSYTYDSDTGLINSITDNKGTTQINYDQANNKLSIVYANGRSLSYTFDDMGRRTQLVTQDGSNVKTVNYDYDTFGRLSTLLDGSNNIIVSYAYDSAGRLQTEMNANSTYTVYGYNAANQQTSVVNYAANGTISSRFNYTYDALGRRTSMTTRDGTWNYTYDMAGQLTRAIFNSTNATIADQDLTYVYDAAGNRIQTIENGVTSNYQTNNLNQYTSEGAATYRYDADGNLISKVEAGKTWRYAYDEKNRLFQVIDPDNNRTQYEYDVFGNRSATIYNGQRTEYLIDPFGMGDVLAEYNGSGDRIAQYTHGLGLVSRTGGGNTAYYDFDANGSTVALTGTTGGVLNRYSYRPFGEDFYEVETVANSFEYVGQFGVMEESNGLDFMRARYYTSSEGRFLNPDPVGIVGGLNLYTYVENNPVSLIDPIGLWGFGGQLGASIGGGNGYRSGVYADATVQYGTFYRGLNPFVYDRGGVVSGTAFGITDGVGSGFGYTNGDFITGIDISPPSPGGFITGVDSAEELASIDRNYTISTPAGSITFGFGPRWKDWVISVTPGGNPLNWAIKRTSGGSLPFRLPFVPPPSDRPLPPGTLPDFIRDILNRFNLAAAMASPLVLDLDGDGIELTALETPVIRFDIDGDGFREATGWVKPDDGLLVFDRNRDGFINDNSELFGSATTSGFTILRQLDTNRDNFITAADTNFSDLQIWRDLDSDGRSDANELYSLEELGITRIRAIANRTDITNAGNSIKETTFYEFADGTQREIVDVWFAVNQLNSRYDHLSTANEPVTFTNEILSQISLKGYGNLPDLYISMAKDGQLLALVKDFTQKMSQQDIVGASNLIRSIMFRWAGVDDVNPTSRGSSVDAQELGFLEKFLGRFWQNSPTSAPGWNQGQALSPVFTELFSALTTRLVVQAATMSVKYDALSDRLVFNGTLTEAQTRFDQLITQASFLASVSSELELSILRQYLDEQGVTNASIFGNLASDKMIGSTADEQFYGFGGNDTIEGGNGNDGLLGGTGNDSLNGGNDYGNDALYGGAGDDSLNGGSGNDIFYGGTGNDSLNGGSGNDTVYGGAGDDFYVLDFTSETILENINEGIDTISFSSHYTLGANLENLILSGTSNANGTGNALNNIITGNSGNNTLNGSDGSDTLIGGLGNDTYSVDTTTDTILENANEGIDLISASVTYTLGTNLDNLTLTGTNNHNGTGNTLNNVITGNSGSNILIGGDGNDTLTGGESNDTLNGSSHDDVLTGGTGNDALFGSTGIDRVVESGNFNFTLTNTTLIGNGTDSLNSVETAVLTSGSSHNRLDTSAFTLGSVTLDGASGNDTLIGGASNDVLIGGVGNDVLEGGSGIDVFIESGSANYLLYDTDLYKIFGNSQEIDSLNGIETVFLTGGSGNNELNADNFTLGSVTLDGGSGSDRLKGGSRNDILVGGAGNDTLIGNAGSDRHIYDTNATFTSSAVGIDMISGFIAGTDKIVLDKTTFTALKSVAGNGFSVQGEFAVVSSDEAASTTGALIAYSSATGNLFYNQNGAAAGLGSGAQFADFISIPSLTAADFVIQV